MSKLGSFIGFFNTYRYYLVVIIGVVMVGFVGQDSVLNHIKNQEKIAVMKEEIADYNARNRRDMDQMRLLDTDPKAMEKIARERYFMKADDEDIFVLSTDIPGRKTTTGAMLEEENDTTIE